MGPYSIIVLLVSQISLSNKIKLVFQQYAINKESMKTKIMSAKIATVNASIVLGKPLINAQNAFLVNSLLHKPLANLLAQMDSTETLTLNNASIATAYALHAPDLLRIIALHAILTSILALPMNASLTVALGTIIMSISVQNAI